MVWQLVTGVAVGVVALGVLAAGGCEDAGARTRSQAAPATTQPGPGFAVVELFTSEGCSSCPPADAYLAEMIADARRSGRRVYPIAFHVDYWNRLGWTDPYSDAAYSRRQEAYAAAARSDSVYTPQMIVNGTEQFVGSDRAKVAASIGGALERAATQSVDVRVDASTKNKLFVEYTLDPAPVTGMTLNVALVERGLATAVARGENGGQTLRHDNVVRAFVSQPLRAAKGRVGLNVPASVKLANAGVIAFVQDDRSKAIVGAAGVDVTTRVAN